MTPPRFFDSSALLKRFVKESGTEAVDRVLDAPDGARATSWIAVVEIVSVLVRKKNDRRITDEQFREALRTLDGEVIAPPGFELRLPEEEEIRLAMPLVVLHNINASDALILESARRWFAEVGHGEFWTNDRRLLRAARDEGMQAIDPTDPANLALSDFPPTSPSSPSTS